MTQAQKWDLFISYADADHAWVEGYLLDALSEAGVNYYTEAAFVLGAIRLQEFERAIRQSNRTLLVISSAYLANSFNLFSDVLAQSYGLDNSTWPVIPLILQPVVELPARLKMLVKLNATNSEEQEEAIHRLCADIKQSQPTPASKPPCPYPGMMSFSEQMSDRFFGRDQDVDELKARLRLNPFIAVIGPSGSGKSSLVLAGLIPHLRHSTLFGAGEWLIHIIRPGETPLANLKNKLGSDLINPSQVVTQALQTQPNAQRLLLVIDQFEEVFTIAETEAVPFAETLLRLINVPNSYLILTVRADFYPELMNSPLWQKIKSHRLEVLPLEPNNLRQAILRPAEDVDVFIEPALIERLITDAAREPGVLPLIQETLVLLWERVERRFLPLRAYEALVLPRKAYGGIAENPRTGLQIAISRRADAAIANLNEEQQVIARRIFLRLVQFGEGRADTRRQQSVNELRAASDEPRLFDQTLSHLADRRLLTLSGLEDTSIKVDIAHEALIIGWPSLQKWLVERREAEQTRRRLESKTQEWLRLGAGNSGLLDEVELAEAQRWLNSDDATDLGYSELPKLVQASDQAIQEVKQREEAARQRELDLIRENLEQEKKASEQERKALKASQLTNRIAIISIFALTGLTIYAIHQQRVAQKNATEAERQSVYALSKTSEAFSVFEYKRLETLVAAVQAGSQFKKAHLEADSILKLLVAGTLQQAIYGMQESNRLSGHNGDVQSVSFSPDGQIIASASSEDKTIKLWNLKGENLKTLKGHSDAVNSISFSPDGKTIVSASSDKTIKLWNLKGENLKTLNGHSDAVNSVSFSPDGQTIVSASSDKTIKLWNLKGENLKTLNGHSDAVNSVSFSPNGQTIASASSDKTIKLWNLKGENLKTLNGHSDAVNSVSFSRDGQTIASASSDKTIKLWNLKGENLKTLEGKSFNADNNIIYSVTFSPDGKTIASASWGIIQLWDLNGQNLETLNAHNDRVLGLSFSPDNKTLASASGDNTIKLWNLNGKKLQRFAGHKDEVNSVSFSPDGKTIASASSDKTIKLWNLKGENLKTFNGHSDRVNSVSFSPDGKTLASASSDASIILWSLDGQILKTLFGHRAEVYNVNFSLNGNTLASASEDNTIILWSKDGQELKTLKGHGYKSKVGAVISISFSPDGMNLASASADQNLILWNLNLDNLLNDGCDWLRDYLSTNVNNKDKHDLCNKV
ncbi:MAG: TIR domain-containing protein [Nostoc sp.]|uniref:nSTAND1 domain-containing NTPase n=1 Tax=Nostoc sp. TaxID=1180 RepID=UPI002FF4D20E